MTDLKRSLGLVDGLAMVIGITVGSGIFRTPGLVAARLGRPGLTFVAWVLGAGLALLGALCFSELTTRLPRAGGKYVYVREAFGPRAGFVVGSIESVAVNGAAIAAIGVAAGEFLVRLMGWTPGRAPGGTARWPGRQRGGPYGLRSRPHHRPCSGPITAIPTSPRSPRKWSTPATPCHACSSAASPSPRRSTCS